MTETRRKARAIILQILYEVDSAGHDLERVIDHLIAEGVLSEENVDFVRRTASSVLQNMEAIDGNIKNYASAWPMEQMAVIDRSILRLAISEILYNNEVSVKIAINEAVELAKKFGSKNSSKFINGVLGSISGLTSR